MRLDIKKFYASIDRGILLKQLAGYFNHPMLRNYFEQIVNIPINRHAEIINHDKGIPRHSSLSPFFGAVYLQPVLEALQQRKGVECFLYVDDFVILIKTRRQYQRAKKVLYQVLDQLALRLSPSKSKMGRLNQFHCLGIDFQVSRNPEKKNPVSVQLHPRSCARALDKVKVLLENAVHPATVQCYLARWSRWWSATLRPISYTSFLTQWVCHAISVLAFNTAWLGRGLLAWRLACTLAIPMGQCCESGT